MRPRSAKRIVLAGASALLASGCATGGSPTPPSDVDVSGTWVLDASASDDFESAAAARPPAVARRGGAGGGAGGGRIVGPGGGGRVMDRESVQRAMASLSRAPERLTIEQADSAVTFRRPDGQAIVLPTSGARLGTAWFDGAQVEVRADWRGGALRIERSRDDVTAVDTWSRSPGSTRLVVQTTLSGGIGGEVRLQRVYDLDAAALLPGRPDTTAAEG